MLGGRMSITEVVRGLSGLYYNHLNDKIDYSHFVDKSRQVTNSSSLELNVNTVYSELYEVGTKQLIAGYIKEESNRRKTKVPINDAFSYVQTVFHYAEFFIKYELLLPRISTQGIKKRFESVFKNNFCLDDAIDKYNQEIEALNNPDIRPYLVGPKQAIESIRDRAKKDIPQKENAHKNKYKLPIQVRIALL